MSQLQFNMMLLQRRCFALDDCVLSHAVQEPGVQNHELSVVSFRV